ncbi:MAG TPA: hypothetical protein VJJ23_06710 [Candidatus Nanoarchaeia archaeon]|nr:hypothetical protein [Candidatus Nanoarchaeia archaeon]
MALKFKTDPKPGKCWIESCEEETYAVLAGRRLCSKHTKEFQAEVFAIK